MAAYFTLLNAGDTKKAFARQQEVVMAVVSKLKSPRVLIRYYGQILTDSLRFLKQVLTLEMLRL